MGQALLESNPGAPLQVGLALRSPEESDWGPAPLATGLAIASAELRRLVKAQASRLGLGIVLEDGAGLDPARLQEQRVKLLILDRAAARGSVPYLVRRLKAACPELLVAVLDAAADPDSIMGAIRAGADEFILPPLEEGLATAVAHLQEKLGRSGPAGCVVGVLSAQGGCGATTIACHLALALERLASRNVLLTDLHLDAGMVGFLMNVKNPYSMIDAARNTHRLDLSLWKGLVSAFLPRLDVMPAPAGLAPEALPWRELAGVLRAVRSLYGWVIADLGNCVTPNTLSLLDAVDDLLLVATPELPSLYQGKQVVHRLLEAGFPRAHISAIFNRLPRHSNFSLEEMHNFLGVPVRARIAECRQLHDTYAEGKLAPPGSDLGRGIAALAARLAGVAPAAERRSPFWRLIWGRS